MASTDSPEVRRPIARLHYTDETDAGRTHHSFDIYTEEALARCEAECRREYTDVEARRYPR